MRSPATGRVSVSTLSAGTTSRRRGPRRARTRGAPPEPRRSSAIVGAGRRASRDPRSSRPAPRGCEARSARRAAAAPCRRTSRRRGRAGTSRRATSARSALKPHCASLKRARKPAWIERVVAAREQLALQLPPDVRADGRAACRSRARCDPERIGATSGRKLSRFVDRSTSMYETTSALLSEPGGAEREAPALAVDPKARTSGCSASSSARSRRVVGARVVGDHDRRTRNGNSSRRYPSEQLDVRHASARSSL